MYLYLLLLPETARINHISLEIQRAIHPTGVKFGVPRVHCDYTSGRVCAS